MLDLNISTIIWEIVNFLIITVVLYFLVFKPMTKRAEARAIEKAENKAALERDVEEAAVRLREIEDRLSHLDEEVQVITDEAYSNSQVLQKELLEATRQEADQIMLDAVQEARKEQAIDIKRIRLNWLIRSLIFQTKPCAQLLQKLCMTLCLKNCIKRSGIWVKPTCVRCRTSVTLWQPARRPSILPCRMNRLHRSMPSCSIHSMLWQTKRSI